MELTKNVLICVNQDIMLTALKFRMEKQGFNVVHVGTKKEVRSAISDLQIDLIIADLQMTEVSALNIVKWSKAKAGSVPPFLVMATLDDDGETLLSALNNGANDFIMKPFKPVELYFRINRMVPNIGV